jgi:pimeloyl-ACP methyl ester carboxylesterase
MQAQRITLSSKEIHMLRRLVLTCSVFLTVLVPISRGGEDQFFDSNGVKIRYVVEGKGEPVLLIHGFTVDAEKNWKLPGIIKELSKDYQVIALDNRGHGKSDKPHDPKKYGLEMVEDAVRLLDHLQIKKAHIVGYSMGAVITLKLLAAHPDRFLTATLGGHGGIKEGADTSFYDKIADSLDQGKGLGLMIARLTPPGQQPPTPEQVKQINAMLLANNDPKALAAVARGFKELMVSWDKLEANQVPTLVLVGDQDPLKKGVDELKGKMSNLTITLIKDAHHGDAFGRPEFIKTLREFLAVHQGK